MNREFAQGTVLSYRRETDRLFMLPKGSARLEGALMDAVRRVEREELLDAELWKLFVRQYRSNVDDADEGWRCEYWGKMMRGACFTYRTTMNEALYTEIVATVRDMLTAQDADGRFSSYSKEMEFRGWDLWGRKYILLGFQYFLEINEDEALAARIIEAMKRHADYIIEHIGDAAEGKKEINEAGYVPWSGMNSSSILEPIVRLYMLTKEIRYLEFADYIVGRGGCGKGNLFELAYEGRLYPFEYPVIKAYEMMSCFEGLLEYYRVTGIEKWRVATENFARLVAQSDITVIGSAGCTHELFDHSSVRQLDATEKGVMQETCVTVTWMKLCFQLLCLTGDSFFADEMERSIYNALLGAINVRHRKPNIELPPRETEFLPNGLPFDSYSPLLPGVRGRHVGGYKVMENGTYYGCCAAIGAAGTGLIGMAAGLQSKDGVALNFFAKGRINAETPEGKPLALEIETEYPVDGRVRIAVYAEGRFALRIRIPKWSRDTRVSVNGKNVPRVAAGNYLAIDRAWTAGDCVNIDLDMRMRLVLPEEYGVSGDEAPYFALRRGPLVFARDEELGDCLDRAVSLKTDEDGNVAYAAAKEERVETQYACDVALKDGGALRVIDYASAGKSWDPHLRIAAWMARA